jgi:hypothetical protein
MKNKFLFFMMFFLFLLGIYSPASNSQTYNMWATNDALNGNSWSFDVYIQRTGTIPLSVYSFQIGLNYTTAAKGTGTLTAVWSNVDAQIVAVENVKAINCVTIPYIKCGFNVNSGGTGAGILISDVTPLKIGTITVTNSVAWVSLPLISWYFGGAPGLPTKIQASDGTLAADVTANGTFSYVNPNGGLLPMELTSFTSALQGRSVVLNWETKTEINSNKFDIERCLTSNTKWSTIASVQASGTSNKPMKYSYSDMKLQSGKYQYRLKMIDNDGSFKYSSVEAAEVAIPKDFAVSQNYPNPFNPSTTIAYQVPVDAKVIMEVYNITGQKVSELVNQDLSAGYYTANFGASNLSSGIYIYRVVAVDKASGNNFSSVKKMMLLK